MSRRLLHLPLATLLALAACPAPDPGPADGGAPPPAKAVAEYAEPEEVVPWGWLVGLNTDGPDRVWDALEQGTFVFPETEDYGLTWRVVDPAEDGAIVAVSSSTAGYAVTQVPLEAGERLFARADGVYAVFAGGARQPGDVYHHRISRVPLPADEGLNVVAARLASRGRPSELQLWKTRHELIFNLEDLTAPDLVAGEAHEQWLGVPVLNLTGAPATNVKAKVLESTDFEATTVESFSLPGEAVTQVAFRLVPRAAWPAADKPVPVRLRLEADGLAFHYEREVTLTTVPAGVPFRWTRLSEVDGSVQYAGVHPPADFDPSRSYPLVLSLHGASVKAIGQAKAYAQKDDVLLVAPTNRRRFGFDWEAWGRLDALEALDAALETWNVDRTRVHLTGHSMGGHGTWQLGTLFPGRFATVNPSAGWSSFYSYGGRPRPTGAFARARASSDTNVYLSNLARRGLYVIHGDADDNVPVTESRSMVDLVSRYTSDVVYHEEPGAGHWWNDPDTPGADCVDWPPLFEFMAARTLDPHELDFDFLTPSPWVSASHSFVTARSVTDPYLDARVVSAHSGETVTVTTDNVRSLDLDTGVLQAKGITSVVVDGEAHPVGDGVLEVGPRTGKRAGRHGPFEQVFQRPFCFAYPDGAVAEARYARYLTSYWALLGNGRACALPLSQVTEAVRAERNLVYLGVPASALPVAEHGFDWDAGAVTLDGEAFPGALGLLVFPEGERLSAAVVAPEGEAHLLYAIQPFSSGATLPDYLVWSPERGVQAAGFFDAEWRYDASLRAP